jgi:hypothetical protein
VRDRWGRDGTILQSLQATLLIPLEPPVVGDPPDAIVAARRGDAAARFLDCLRTAYLCLARRLSSVSVHQFRSSALTDVREMFGFSLGDSQDGASWVPFLTLLRTHSGYELECHLRGQTAVEEIKPYCSVSRVEVPARVSRATCSPGTPRFTLTWLPPRSEQSRPTLTR